MSAPLNTPVQPARTWPEQEHWTYEDWAQLPSDGTIYEVIDGVLYMSPPPSTSHETVSNNLDYTLMTYARKNKGRVFTAPVGVRLPNQPVPFQPDLVYVSKSRQHIIGKQYIEGVPDLVVEVLSPSNWPYDRHEKLQVYQEAGIPEYWIVDYRARTVEVFYLEEGEYVLQQGKLKVGDTAVSRALPGFQVAVAEIFRDL